MCEDNPAEPNGRGLEAAVPNVAVVLDDQGRVLEVLTNDHPDDLLDTDQEALSGQSVSDLFPEATAERLHGAIQQVLETGTVQTHEYELDGTTDAPRFRSYVAPLPADGQRDSGVVWITEPITATPDTEQWLARLTAIISDAERSFEETLGGLFELGCERFDLDRGVLACLDPERDCLEVEFTSETDEFLSPGTERPLSDVHSACLLEESGPVSQTTSADGDADRPLPAEDGTGTWFGIRIEIADGLDRVLFFTAEDTRTEPFDEADRQFLELIAQWVKYELEWDVREERERRIEAIFDQTYQFTGLLEPDGTLVEANQTALEFGGLDREDVVGKKLWDSYWFRHSQETRDRAREAVQRAVDGEFVRHELPVEGADREAIIDFSIRPVTDESGDVALLIPEGRDITERKRHEDRLEAINEATRRLWDADSERAIAEIVVESIESILDEHLVAVWSHDGSKLVPLAVTDAANAFDETDGAEMGSIPPGTTEMRLFRENDLTVLSDYSRAESPAHPETPLGSLLIAPLDEYGQLHVGSQSVDAFDEQTVEMIEVFAKNAEAALGRQARERELERSRDRLARTEQLAAVGGWELDLETGSQFWTDGTRQIHEVPADFEPSLEDGIEFYHPDDRDRIREVVERCRTTGEPYDVEARLITATGRERWVESTGEAVEEDGEIVRLEGAIRDVTTRKRREQQLSVLYRILRHNLRNDLNVVTGFAEAIDRDLDRLEAVDALDDSDVETLDRLEAELSDPPASLESDLTDLREALEGAKAVSVEEIQEYVARIQSSSADLMSIGNKASRLQGLITEETANERHCQIASAVETAATEVRQEFPEATIDTSDVRDATIAATPEMLTVALREVLRNAIAHADRAEPPVEVRTDRGQSEYVHLEIVDQGPGIPAQELDALRQGRDQALLHGSGIGLWLVNWLVSHLDGHLSIDSDEADGTTVTMTLPVADGNDSRSPERPDSVYPESTDARSVGEVGDDG